MLKKHTRKGWKKELDIILHWNLSVVGGFLGTYAILLYDGTFASAQTGNLMAMATALTQKNFTELAIRLLALVVFGAAIVISYLMTTLTAFDMKKLVLWVDAAGLLLSAYLPKQLPALVRLYPIFFCTAFQWGSYSGAAGYNSASIFSTNNLKQACLAWTQYVLTKEKELQNKAILYTGALLSFFAGACLGCICVFYCGAYSAWIGLCPLAAARILLVFREQ